MVIIPLYLFLFVYVFFLAICAAYYLIILYHIIHSASFSLQTFFVTFFIFASGALILYGTVELVKGVDWQQPAITIADGYFNSTFIE